MSVKVAVNVLDSLPLEVLVPGENLSLGACQHAVQPTQHGERQDDIGILAPLEIVPKNLIGHRPNEIDYLLNALCQWTLLLWYLELIRK